MDWNSFALGFYLGGGLAALILGHASQTYCGDNDKLSTREMLVNMATLFILWPVLCLQFILGMHERDPDYLKKKKAKDDLKQ